MQGNGFNGRTTTASPTATCSSVNVRTRGTMARLESFKIMVFMVGIPVLPIAPLRIHAREISRYFDENQQRPEGGKATKSRLFHEKPGGTMLAKTA
jgi:hypothetical protein